MIHNQWLWAEWNEQNPGATESKREMFRKMLLARYKQHKLRKLALNSCTRKDCPSCTKFNGKFQEASTLNKQGRMYPYKISEMLRGDEVSD